MCVTFSLDCADGYCEYVRDMSETFTKLFGSITDSTIWLEDSDTRIVWVTMLAMSDRFGYVGASLPGLAARAHVPLEKAEAALAKFMAPDPYSRSKDFEGRRIEEADRGWNILNYERFRDMRDEEARKEYERVRKREQRHRVSRHVPDKSVLSLLVPESPVVSAHAEADTEADPEIKQPPQAAGFSPDFMTFWKLYPKRRNKGDAWKAWRTAKNLKLDDLLNALSWQVHSPAWRKDGGQFIPYPASYIRARAWEDEPDSMAPSQKPDSREEERRSRPLARIPGT